MSQHTVVFQYLTPGAEQPRAGYEITDDGFDVPPGAPVPRVGEFVQIVQTDKNDTYEVLSVVTRIMALGDTEPGWTSIVTVGPVSDARAKLSIVRE
jgi:hypothetical protein